MTTKVDLLIASFLLFFHLSYADTECRVRNLTITVDNFMELYIDGVKQENLPNAGDWTRADTVRVQCYNHVIAVKGTDYGVIAGILASTEDGYVLTNSSWKCTREYSVGWERVEFDDSSWPAAYQIAPQGTSPWSFVQGIRRDASWIWTPYYRGGDLEVYCRKTFYADDHQPPTTTTRTTSVLSPTPQCQLRNLTITAISYFELYIDGEEEDLTNAGSLMLADSVPLPCWAKLIAVKGIDFGDESGILASTEDGYVLTNSSWKCTNEYWSGWELEGFDDSSWTAAYEIGLQGSATRSWVDGIRRDAYWIWTENSSGGDLVVYCRKQLRTDSVEPKTTTPRTTSGKSPRPQCRVRNLTITADDSVELYIDGENQENLTNAGNWRLADSVPLPCTAQVIAIKGIDIGGEGGILASTEDGYVLTNSSWRCTDVFSPGWERVGFDDSSWTSAYEIGAQGTRNWTRIDGITEGSLWIWTQYFTGGDSVVYCRKHLHPENQQPQTSTPQTTSVASPPISALSASTQSPHVNRTLHIATDNFLSLYFDGVKQTELSHSVNWSNSVQVALPWNTRVIAYAGELDDGIEPGILASTDDGFVLTNSSWKCSKWYSEGWEQVNFDDSSWPAAYEEALHGTDRVDGIRMDAYWIWTLSGPDQSGDQFAYCRKTLDNQQPQSSTLETTSVASPPISASSPSTQSPHVNRTLHITADSYFFVFIDGVEQTALPSHDDWSQADQIVLPWSARVIAVEGRDDGLTKAGILASTDDRFVLTNSSWKCTNVFSIGWERVDFDDSSWPAAYQVAPHETSPWSRVEGIRTDAYWIWTEYNPDHSRDRVVHCRMRLDHPHPQTSTLQPSSVTSPAVAAVPADIQSPNVDRILYITVDNYLSLYIDGVAQLGLPNYDDWREADRVVLPWNTRVIAVRGRDDGFVKAGILASTADRFVLTNSSWKCTNDFSVGWQKVDFDDSLWPAAYQVAPHETSPWTHVAGIRTDAYWIWTEYNPDQSRDRIVYCRMDLDNQQPQSSTLQPTIVTSPTVPEVPADILSPQVDRTLYITVDNYLRLFIDGVEQTGLPNSGNWRRADSVRLQWNTRVIAVQGTDDGAVKAGILASTDDRFILTNSSWKCTNVYSMGWERVDFDETSWPIAYQVAPHETSPWSRVAGIRTDAYWIWTQYYRDQSRDRVVYCRMRLDNQTPPISILPTTSVALPTVSPSSVATKSPHFDRILYITVDNSLRLFIDGVEQTGLPNSDDWTRADRVVLPRTTRVIAVQGTDDGTVRAGILASTDDRFVLTNSSWKCTNVYTRWWEQVNFLDSSWPAAYQVAPHETSPWSRVAGIRTDAYWIWTEYYPDQSRDRIVYCRMRLDNPQLQTSTLQTTSVASPSTSTVATVTQSPHVDRILYITADNYLYLYLDGVEQTGLTNYDNWRRADRVVLPWNTQVIAVKGRDDGIVAAGVLASTDDRFVLTNSSWKCTNVYSIGWERVDFDDSSWPIAYQVALHETSPWSRVAGIRTDAYWIWTAHRRDQFRDEIVYCRKRLVPYNPVTPRPLCPLRNLAITVDNYMRLWIDGIEKRNLPYADNWRRADTVDLPWNTRLIAVQGTDDGTVAAGILGSTEDGYIVTNASWKCTNLYFPGWNQIGYDDSSWPAAYVVAAHGASPWFYVTGIRINAYWIWTTTVKSRDLVVYCRKNLVIPRFCELS